jgi:hypothetical protein
MPEEVSKILCKITRYVRGQQEMKRDDILALYSPSYKRMDIGEQKTVRKIDL